MRLAELQPLWISADVFAFLCPCCRKWFLTVKSVRMPQREQRELFEAHFGEDWNKKVIISEPECAWHFDSNDFSIITVTPSIDASPAGHWHGFISRGDIQ